VNVSPSGRKGNESASPNSCSSSSIKSLAFSLRSYAARESRRRAIFRRRYCWAGFRRGANSPAVSILRPDDALLKDDLERRHPGPYWRSLSAAPC
jgi:hypothetical protein